jgi:hypothetical protein
MVLMITPSGNECHKLLEDDDGRTLDDLKRGTRMETIPTKQRIKNEGRYVCDWPDGQIIWPVDLQMSVDETQKAFTHSLGSVLFANGKYHCTGCGALTSMSDIRTPTSLRGVHLQQAKAHMRTCKAAPGAALLRLAELSGSGVTASWASFVSGGRVDR